MPRIAKQFFFYCVFIFSDLSFALPSIVQETKHLTSAQLSSQVPLLPAQITQIDSALIEFAEQRVPDARATIVFENGLLLDMSTWRNVAAGLNHCCNLLFYNRPGVGRSTRGDSEITPATASARLQQLLQQREFKPPYLLVGHSLGGQYVQAFTKRYPEQVHGLLLVDALPLGVARPYHELPWATRMGLWIFASKTARDEIANIDTMSRYVMEHTGFYTRPIIRIIAKSLSPQDKPQGFFKDLLRGVIYAENFGVWALDPEVAESRMNTFYPQSELRTITAHHRIQEQHPEAVIDAILSLIDKQNDKREENVSH